MKLIRSNIINQICDDYVVTSQIEPADISEIAKAGYKTILCTRPDGEDPDQIDFAKIAAACDEQNIRSCQIPVTGAGITEEHLADFMQVYDNLPRPIFGYCRSGTRAGTLYQMTAQMR